MKDAVTRLIFIAIFALTSSTFAHAQGVTASLSGTVVDRDSGVIPGASVVVKNKATGTTFDTTTNATGTYSVPSLDVAIYTVTVSLAGFKTVIVDDVRLLPGTPAAVNATLEVGALEETIVVVAASELINTQSATVSANLNADQINRMPLPTRNALNAVTFLVGVNTASTNRNSTINGLPESFINITLDGVSNNDNFNKSTDGFFANVTPRQDAVEAVGVTTAAGGADVGGHGAASINFVTRSGSNRFTGSAYEYYRAPALNSNYWFNVRNNLPKNDVTLNQYGFRQGGPIVIPGLYDGRGKAFFFVNYEELRLPNNFSRTRTVLHPRAQQGWFRYAIGQDIREVNVLQLAAASGQLASIDPTVARVLGYINSAMGTTGAINATSDPLVNDYVWQSPGRQTETQPVIRIDYNLNNDHRLAFTSNQISVVRDPDHLNGADRRFPVVDELSKVHEDQPLAIHHAAVDADVEPRQRAARRHYERRLLVPRAGVEQRHPDLYRHRRLRDRFGRRQCPRRGPDQLARRKRASWRSAYAYNIDESLSWQKGRHSVMLGGGVYLGRAWENAQQIVPAIDLGFDQTQDPASGLFTTGNFQGATANHLADARALYALLTGRVVAVTGQAALDEATRTYVAFGPRRRAGKMNEYSLFAQDSWRATPALTISAGVRWDVQSPFSAVNDIMSSAGLADVCGISGLGSGGVYDACNFYDPGAKGGKTPVFSQLTTGTQGYRTDWNNVAPNVGVAWRPDAQTGWLRTLLGDPDQATLRAGYSIAYERQGMGVFTGQFGPNPGSTLSLTRNLSTGIVGPGESWPVLLRESNRLYNAPFPETPAFPIAIRPNRADSIEAFHPDINIASARTWTVGLQRALSKDTAVEIRYVGTRGVDQWSELNYNERNVIENGFIDEFKLAMANLTANNASGAASRAGSFAYFGPGTGTNPLPIYLAYLNASRDANNPAAYTGGTNTWTNTTLAQRLVRTNPNVNSGTANAAIDLDGNLTRRQNALAAGLPANFFVVNPDANAVNVFDSGASSHYHALQLEVRRRLSKGLQVNGSYQYARESGSSFLGFHFGRVMNDVNASVRHAIKTQWDWTIPAGRGERFGRNAGSILNGIIGGWQFNGVGRIQARTANFGNVRLVGMTLDEAQKLYRWDVRIDPLSGLKTVYTMPDDVIQNTRRAFSVSTTSVSGYSDLGAPEGRYFAPANSADCLQLKAGDCAPRTLMLISPFFARFDMGITKRFPLRGNTNFELRFDVLNVFNNINFDVTDNSRTPGTGAGIFQTNAAYTDASNTFDPGGRLGMLVFRLNW